MARQVVASPAALEGIDAVPGRDLYRADGAEEFAAALAAAISAGAQTAIGRAARVHVLAMHDWQASFRRLDAILDRLGTGEPYDGIPAAVAPRTVAAGVRPT
jgi:hypothetical protein